jgi:hypothetical protein
MSRNNKRTGTRNHDVKLGISWIAAAVLAGAIAIFTATSLFAQTADAPKPDSDTQQSLRQAIADKEIELLRMDMRSKRKQVVAMNLPLTDDEALKFWPVYDQYMTEMIKINDSRFALIKDYAASYFKMTDEQATGYIRRTVDLDKSIIDLRAKYVPIVEKVLPEKKTAIFFQVDRRLQLATELQLTRLVQLVMP